jgi:hypothetical protein
MFDSLKRLAVTCMIALTLSIGGVLAGVQAASAASPSDPVSICAAQNVGAGVSRPPEDAQTSNFAPYLPQSGGYGGGG